MFYVLPKDVTWQWAQRHSYNAWMNIFLCGTLLWSIFLMMHLWFESTSFGSCSMNMNITALRLPANLTYIWRMFHTFFINNLEPNTCIFETYMYKSYCWCKYFENNYNLKTTSYDLFWLPTGHPNFYPPTMR